MAARLTGPNLSMRLLVFMYDSSNSPRSASSFKLCSMVSSWILDVLIDSQHCSKTTLASLSFKRACCNSSLIGFSACCASNLLLSRSLNLFSFTVISSRAAVKDFSATSFSSNFCCNSLSRLPISSLCSSLFAAFNS